MNLVEEIRQSWDWTGINPTEVVGENHFGNLIVKDDKGRYWRLCPEDGYCKVIAKTRAELDALSSDRDFLEDWHMTPLVSLATATCGPLVPGRKY